MKYSEYDIGVDTEEPLQVLTFVPERPRKSFSAEDDTERQVASFTLGQGKADWGPLTVYAVMKSGDIYAICPYMPQNTCVPRFQLVITLLNKVRQFNSLIICACLAMFRLN